MILNNAPQNEAIVSNVGQIGEFRIRNSAKAFNILSSGLYANKIRAIIRELSCNAVDSHTAAGKASTPFDVHLPNQLEPWFAIRDYGTGLSHDQVTNIYTTYFESTKTDSNDYIGALGLGSKSPFSYTDNFTVTAIKDGKKGIYTAFINEQGVPSIALMMTEDTDEPAGVEVRFAVNDRWDFDKFRQEARIVYKHFGLRPVVSGSADFQFVDAEYESKDIIPGVHAMKNGSTSAAIMGNIAYLIDIPKADSSLGDLRGLLNCGLEMHFGIGELDFQASREGLSYIPTTVEAIKNKLDAVNKALTGVLAKEADAIPNLWDRALFLAKKRDQRLWQAAVVEYVRQNPLPTFDHRPTTFELKVEDLRSLYNIQIRAFQRYRGTKNVKNLKTSTAYGDKQANGHYETWQVWNIPVDPDSHFVTNDLKVGAGSRIQHHYRETNLDCHSRNIYLIEPADKTKAALIDKFFAKIHEPPVTRRVVASSLMEKARRTLKNVEILKLERRGGSGYRRADDDMVWRDAGKADDFDNTKTYYYVPLSGFIMQSSKGYTSGRELYDDVKCLSGLFAGEIYGVRKKDIEDIKGRANWKNFEEHISAQLLTKDVNKILLSLVRNRLDNTEILNYSKDVLSMIDPESYYKKVIEELGNIELFKGNAYNVERLFKRFAPTANLSPDALVSKYQAKLDLANKRYPLLQRLNSYRVEAKDIAEYINLIDDKKGIKNESI